MKALSENFPYRYYLTDCRGWIEKFNENTKRYIHMYECDSTLQLLTAIEDYDYTLWLDPEDVPCYRDQRGDVVKSPYVSRR